MEEEKNDKTIQERIKNDQETLIEQLKKVPIVQIACQKANVGRASYYRWRRDSEEFKKRANQAIKEGTSLISDLAESNLLSAIKDSNLRAIFFWLQHKKKDYANKMELSGKIKTESDKLTAEQQEAIEKALRLSSLIEGGNENNN